jgi:hypothetical protein
VYDKDLKRWVNKKVRLSFFFLSTIHHAELILRSPSFIDLGRSGYLRAQTSSSPSLSSSIRLPGERLCHRWPRPTSSSLGRIERSSYGSSYAVRFRPRSTSSVVVHRDPSSARTSLGNVFSQTCVGCVRPSTSVRPDSRSVGEGTASSGRQHGGREEEEHPKPICGCVRAGSLSERKAASNCRMGSG